MNPTKIKRRYQI